MFDQDDRSFPATPRRRQQAAREGQVARSYELGVALSLLGASATLSLWGDRLIEFFSRLAIQQLRDQPELTTQPDAVVFQLRQLLVLVGLAVVPLLGASFLFTLASHGLQVGFLWLPQKLSPDWSRLDPMEGFRRRFQVSQILTFALGAWRLILGIAIALAMLWQERQAISACIGLHPAEVSAMLFQMLVRILATVSGMFVVLGLGDYLYQRWRLERALRMSASELREELRQN